MKTVAIFVPESSVMEAIADPRYMFTTANQFLQANDRPPLFDVQLVGQSKEVELLGGVFTVRTDKLLKDAKKTDLIIIPALFGDMKTAVEKNKAAIPWIIDQYNNGAEVASLCVGAFLLVENHIG